jgi:hypothetical protein
VIWKIHDQLAWIFQIRGGSVGAGEAKQWPRPSTTTDSDESRARHRDDESARRHEVRIPLDRERLTQFRQFVPSDFRTQRWLFGRRAPNAMITSLSPAAVQGLKPRHPAEAPD